MFGSCLVGFTGRPLSCIVCWCFVRTWQGLYCSLRQLLEDGFFHADPHPGNLVATADGSLAYFDFGMMGDIPRHYRVGLIQMVSFLDLVTCGYACCLLHPFGASLRRVINGKTRYILILTWYVAIRVICLLYFKSIGFRLSFYGLWWLGKSLLYVPFC